METNPKGLSNLAELEKLEVVRPEFISTRLKAKITLNYDSILFNAACLALLPKTQYVQVLIDKSRKRIVLLPCKQHTKDALKWCSVNGEGKFKPKNCLARIFGAKLYDMMSWVKDNRYKVLAFKQELDGVTLIVFNLEECEMSVPDYLTKPDGKVGKVRKTYLPGEWREHFGMTYREHQETSTVDINAHYMLSDKDREVTVSDGRIVGKTPTAEDVIMSQYRTDGEGAAVNG